MDEESPEVAPGLTAAQLAELNVPAKPSDRATRKVAATATGYSGSTLDKVDKIRDAAERGVIKRGKEEIPAPEPVVEVAKKALENVKQTGAAVDRSTRELNAAVETYVGALDPPGRGRRGTGLTTGSRVPGGHCRPVRRRRRRRGWCGRPG